MSETVLTLLFLLKGDQLLLAMKKRGFGEGRWNGVGGKIQAGESIKSAMIREANEEVGITPSVYEKVADITFDEYFKGQPALMHVHVFIATKWSGDPTESDEMAPKWFTIPDLPYDTMWPDDRHWLPQVLNGDKIIAHFKLDPDDSIISHTIRIVQEL